MFFHHPAATTVLTIALACSNTALAGTAVHSGGSAVAVEPVVENKGVFDLSIQAGIETLSGDNTMQIGFPVQWVDGTSQAGPFPVSELVFPLESLYATFGLQADIQDRFIGDFSLSTNITEPDDHLTDRDWITVSNPNLLDIYSESEISSFDALLWSMDLSYKVLRTTKGWMAAGMGYQYQDFSYQARLLRQWSPSGLSGVDAVGDGRTAIDYSLTYSIPYFLVQGEVDLSPDFSFSGRLSFSPWVNAEDTDQHLLRGKENSGDLDGTSWTISLAGQYNVTDHWFSKAGFQYTGIQVDGDASASFYGQYNHTVTEAIDSSQSTFFLTAGYTFGPTGQQ